MNEIHTKFLRHASKRKIRVMIKPGKFEELREEYSGKIPFLRSCYDCLDWLSDVGKRDLTTLRLRNWVKRAIIYQKEADLRSANRRKEAPVIKKNELGPKWTPPE